MGVPMRYVMLHKNDLMNGTLLQRGITIYVPVVYMARNLMIVMGATSFTMAIGRCGPGKSRLFWARKWQRVKRVPFGTKITINVAALGTI
jgi:hypothetical protein